MLIQSILKTHQNTDLEFKAEYFQVLLTETDNLFVTLYIKPYVGRIQKIQIKQYCLFGLMVLVFTLDKHSNSIIMEIKLNGENQFFSNLRAVRNLFIAS